MAIEILDHPLFKTAGYLTTAQKETSRMRIGDPLTGERRVPVMANMVARARTDKRLREAFEPARRARNIKPPLQKAVLPVMNKISSIYEMNARAMQKVAFLPLVTAAAPTIAEMAGAGFTRAAAGQAVKSIAKNAVTGAAKRGLVNAGTKAVSSGINAPKAGLRPTTKTASASAIIGRLEHLMCKESGLFGGAVNLAAKGAGKTIGGATQYAVKHPIKSLGIAGTAAAGVSATGAAIRKLRQSKRENLAANAARTPNRTYNPAS